MTCAKILWDFQIQMDKQVMANQPDIVVVDKEQKRAVVIDVAIPSDNRIRKKEHEKLEKYQGLREQLERMWGEKTSVIPVVIRALRAVTPKLVGFIHPDWLLHDEQLILHFSDDRIFICEYLRSW
ncbi:hypothetical protein L3Q82_008918 [Scortum barcoo]|uniref:Uncharacterized protein n=1 Tax=Scortum barcoo TaxID=214431 RepID=A0ACB8XCE6_9TELE|nr:hypothetical protein L3Q82_008918 [Scortum barcoo]